MTDGDAILSHSVIHYMREIKGKGMTKDLDIPDSMRADPSL